MRIVSALCLVGLAICGCTFLNGQLPQPYLALIFLVAVLIAAAGFGRGAGLTAAFASFFTYNFFFVPPTFTFRVADPSEFIALVAFLLVAILTGSLAGRLKEKAAAADHRAELIQSLYDYAGHLAGTTELDTALHIICEKIQTILKTPVALLVKKPGEIDHTIFPQSPNLLIDHQDRDEFEIINKSRTPEPRRLIKTHDLARDYLPIQGSHGLFGVVIIERRLDERSNESEQRVLDALIKQARIAIERIQFATDSQESRLQADQERLRSAILSALSHDLRTPLASILGSATAIRTLGDHMTSAERDDLLMAIEEEAGRLNLFCRQSSRNDATGNREYRYEERLCRLC